MKSARKFIQPMEHTGLPNTSGWAGFEYLQWTGSCFHPGLDYNWKDGEQDKGKHVFVIGSGICEKVLFWDGKTKGFGNHIFIKHILEKTGETIYSHYCHLNKIYIQEKQEISVGDIIGECGGSGGWPSHLHLELRKATGKGYNFWPKGYTAEWIADRYFDPYQFIEDRKGGTMSANKIPIEKEVFENLVNKSGKWDDIAKALRISVDAPAKNAINIAEKNLKAYNKLVDENGELQKEIERLRGEIESQVEDFERAKIRSSTECKTQKKISKDFLAKLASILDSTQDQAAITAEVTLLCDNDEKIQKEFDEMRKKEIEWKGRIIDLEKAIAKYKAQLESQNLSDQDFKKLIKAILRRLINIIKEFRVH